MPQIAKPAVSPPVDPAEPTAPSIDIGPLGQLTGYALRRAQLAVFDDFIETLAELNLRPGQYSVLLVLERNPGSTQSAIASALGIQRANFVALLDTLEKRGLARRAAAANDKRSHALYLTPLGQSVLKAANALVSEHEARQTGKIEGHDMATFLAILNRLAAT